MKASDLVVRCLEAEGVRFIFGVPGEETEDLLFSLENSTIEFVPCRHEQGAAFIADVWGRLTGKAGVCLSTLGPGATNLVTPVADANLDKAPLVAITAQGGLDRLHHESHQQIDIIRTFESITKWNSAIYDPKVLPEIVRKAFKLAELEKPGATHIELAEDVARLEVSPDSRPLSPRPAPRPQADQDAVCRAVRLLRQARRSLVIAGNGAIREHASRALTRLAEDNVLPVVATFMGKGAISDRSPQSLFCIGTGFRDYVTEAVTAADLVVTVGYDIAEYSPDRWNWAGDKTVIHVDSAPAEVYGRYQADVEIIGDIAATIGAICVELGTEPLTVDPHWYAPVRERIRQDIASYTLEGLPLTVPGALNIIRDALPDDGLLISDVGSHKVWIARNFPTYCPNGCIISNGLAAMGIALPGGIAAALSNPGRAVVAAMGDGGFLMNSQELETAKRLGVGFTIVIFNDNDYGLISWKQEISRGRSIGTRIGNPDFKSYAESFGIAAQRPESVDELRSVVRDAIKSRELRLIEIPVDSNVNRQLVGKLQAYWHRKSTVPEAAEQHEALAGS
jgi:acetolactate synthase-1/2/3 large subunit